MAKIKGWSKTLELPYRIDYNNTTKDYHKGLGLGHCALIISRERKYPNATMQPQRNEWKDTWQVTYRWYAGAEQGQQYKDMKDNMTKEEALQYAYTYMRANPNG
jgi:hypothetical protein